MCDKLNPNCYLTNVKHFYRIGIEVIISYENVLYKGGEKMTDYLLGEKITKENYLTIRKLALKLTAKEFKETTSFGHGVHNRIRRFPNFQEYKTDEKVRAEKYGYIKNRRNTERKTVNDVYSKLESIEAKILDITQDNKRHDLFAVKYYYLNKRDANGDLTRGILLDDGQFLVFPGSQARLDHTKSYAGQKGNLELKRQLQSKKIVSNSNNNRWLTFKRFYLFNSPSQAASFILGNPTNGWDAWKDIGGRELNQERS